MEVVQDYKVYKTNTDVLMSANLPATLQDLLLKTNCKTGHKGSHLRLGLPRSLFPSGQPTKTLHAPLFLSRTGMVEQGLD
jgi:hypothetical protein